MRKTEDRGTGDEDLRRDETGGILKQFEAEGTGHIKSKRRDEFCESEKTVMICQIAANSGQTRENRRGGGEKCVSSERVESQVLCRCEHTSSDVQCQMVTSDYPVLLLRFQKRRLLKGEAALTTQTPAALPSTFPGSLQLLPTTPGLIQAARCL